MKQLVQIKFKSIHPKAKLPERANQEDIGFDLCSVEECTISGIGIIKIKTGLQLADAYYGLTKPERISYSEAPLPLIKIEGRSSLAIKGIFPVGGIIDTNSYRGEIIVILASLGSSLHTIKVGDKIAQFVLYDVNTHNSNICFTDDVAETIRNSGGFGSTGQ